MSGFRIIASARSRGELPERYRLGRAPSRGDSGPPSSRDSRASFLIGAESYASGKRGSFSMCIAKWIRLNSHRFINASTSGNNRTSATNLASNGEALSFRHQRERQRQFQIGNRQQRHDFGTSPAGRSTDDFHARAITIPGNEYVIECGMILKTLVVEILVT